MAASAPDTPAAERPRALREAEALLRRATELQPRDARAHFVLGTMLLEQKRFVEAAASLETALQTGARHAAWREEAGQALISALREAARE